MRITSDLRFGSADTPAIATPSANKLTNLFLLVSNLEDKKGYIKIGNQRVIEARLSDAKFFWDKNK